jgi:hypothetical protein
MRPPNRSWRVDETYIRVVGCWTYLYRAIDSAGACGAQTEAGPPAGIVDALSRTPSPEPGEEGDHYSGAKPISNSSLKAIGNRPCRAAFEIPDSTSGTLSDALKSRTAVCALHLNPRQN